MIAAMTARGTPRPIRISAPVLRPDDEVPDEGVEGAVDEANVAAEAVNNETLLAASGAVDRIDESTDVALARTDEAAEEVEAAAELEPEAKGDTVLPMLPAAASDPFAS